MVEEKRRITAEDLYKLQIVSDPQIAPSGQHVLFCVQRVDEKTEKKYTDLWLVAAQSGELRQFTYGDHSDRYPRWSPNGQAIAFLSNRLGEKQEQLFVIPFDGGEARPLTDLQGSFASFQWSPDGQQLVCQFRKMDKEALQREEDEHKKELGIVARQITSLDYKLDGSGFLPQEKWHIWTVDTASGAAKQLTEGKYDEREPCWSPDGRQILFISNRSEDPAQEPDADELYLIGATGGEIERVETGYGWKSLPSFAPDGQWIAYLGFAQTGKFYQNSCLYIVPTAGGEAINLSARFDLHLSLATLTDTGSGTPQTAPVWSTDGKTIYCQASERGNQPLLAFAVDQNNGDFKRVIGAEGVVGSFSMDAARQRIAYLWGMLDQPGQVWLHDVGGGRAQALTSFNQATIESIDLGQIEAVNFRGTDGVDLHGWILKPPDFDQTKQYPSILEIHGGPHSQYGNVFMHEFYLLAAQGYVVYCCNPRGSQGYGQDFAAAIYNRWGTVDYEDIMAWADYMEQQPYIDPARMGVCGGSYGGYMTTLIIGRSQRFKAAVAQRLVSNFISFYGSSDMNWLTEALMGTEAPPWSDLENFWRQSPISSIGKATTPTLIIHSEADYRCDREQGEQVFVALKRLGVETELILFPDESHGLSRSGRTDRRVERLRQITRWFEKYLK